MTEQEVEDLNRPVQLKALTRSKKGFAHNLAEWVGIIAAALLAAVVIRTYVLQTFWIPSASMETTLLIHDHVLVNKLAYKYGDIERGDIVVFERPAGDVDPNIKDLIKRVIALPGDSIEAREGVVYLNGAPLSEPYLNPGTITVNLPLTRVPEGSYFMMGDNRSNSADSRTALGMIDRELVVGRADFRIWPVDRVGGL